MSNLKPQFVMRSITTFALQYGCNFRSIISKGKLDTYDIELKRIADEYNSCTIKKEATASDRKAKAYIT